MLYNPKIQRSASVTPPTHREISGRKLNRLVKKSSPRDRALLAVSLVRGEIQVTRHTLKQATALASASLGYTITANQLTPEERTKLARGLLSMSRLHRRHGHDAELDRELDRVVAVYGIDALWRALDRATAPANHNAANVMAAE